MIPCAGASILVLCVLQVPVAPAMGAVLSCLWLVPWGNRVRRDVCVVSWFELMGPTGIVLSARHKHRCPGYMHVQRPGCVVAVCGSCSVVGLCWWADVYRSCVPLVVSCSSS